ncbi:hypothetical protein [Thalassospira australica]
MMRRAREIILRSPAMPDPDLILQAGGDSFAHARNPGDFMRGRISR